MCCSIVQVRAQVEQPCRIDDCACCSIRVYAYMATVSNRPTCKWRRSGPIESGERRLGKEGVVNFTSFTVQVQDSHIPSLSHHLSHLDCQRSPETRSSELISAQYPARGDRQDHFGTMESYIMFWKYHFRGCAPPCASSPSVASTRYVLLANWDIG